MVGMVGHLPSRKISDKKLQYYKTILSTNGRRPRWSGGVKISIVFTVANPPYFHDLWSKLRGQPHLQRQRLLFRIEGAFLRSMKVGQRYPGSLGYGLASPQAWPRRGAFPRKIWITVESTRPIPSSDILLRLRIDSSAELPIIPSSVEMP